MVSRSSSVWPAPFARWRDSHRVVTAWAALLLIVSCGSSIAGVPTAQISIGDARGFEGDSGSVTHLRFPIRATGPMCAPISVEYATHGGTAQAPGDYAKANGTVTLEPGLPTFVGAWRRDDVGFASGIVAAPNG